jgi:ABC-2 type transport system ATP-binding protein
MRMAYVPDNPDMFARLKASEYLNFIADIYEVTTADRQARIEEFAKLLKIDSVLNGKIGSFSHGMKQKLAITASLLSDPENWILDEPMVGLDPEAAYLLKSIMKKRTDAGKAVFFSTHVMEVAERLCDRIGVIHQGRIVFAGSVEELKTLKGSADTLENLFLELVESDVMN